MKIMKFITNEKYGKTQLLFPEANNWIEFIFRKD